MASTIGIEDLSSSAAWRAAAGPDVGNILQLAREAIDSFWRFLLAIPFYDSFWRFLLANPVDGLVRPD